MSRHSSDQKACIEILDAAPPKTFSHENKANLHTHDVNGAAHVDVHKIDGWAGLLQQLAGPGDGVWEAARYLYRCVRS